MYKNGFDEVMRTAGSHGSADLIGLRYGRAYFVQCKRVETLKQANKLIKIYKNELSEQEWSSNYVSAIIVYATDEKEFYQWHNGPEEII